MDALKAIWTVVWFLGFTLGLAIFWATVGPYWAYWIPGIAMFIALGYFFVKDD